MAGGPARLSGNRDFQLLWSGQVISVLGSRVSAVAFPLLVLDLTQSPALAGLTRFAGTLPLLLFTLPAGALLDRGDRKRIMLTTEVARGLALASLALALWTGRLTSLQIVLVAAIAGTGVAFFEVAQRAVLRQIVPGPQLPAAGAQIAAREYLGMVGGPPLGGLLFGIGRVLPFLADALSYLASLASLLLIRTQFQQARTAPQRKLYLEIGEGLAWLWRQPFLRSTSLLVTGSDLVLNALYLAVIVVARERGASSALIGAMLGLVGVAGLVGSLVATRLGRVLPVRAVVIAAMAVPALLTPLLAVVPNPLAIGLIYGGMFFLHPTWGAVIGPYRVTLVPDHLQGRVQSGMAILSFGAVPLGSLLVGVLLQWIGGPVTILIIAAVMVVVALAAVASRSVRTPPPLEAPERS